MFLVFVPLLGCEKPAAIKTYTISTKVPEEFLPKKQRMLGAMFPRGEQVWFFKVVGPEAAINPVAERFRSFIESVPFSDQGPVLTSLPDGWKRAADKPMRFASIAIETPQKQLDVSISSLSRQPDWEQQVLANVNRWRGQLGIDSSQEVLAGGELLKVISADSSGVWVDLTGESEIDATSMSPPFVGSGNRRPTSTLNGAAENSAEKPRSVASNDDPRIQYVRPEGWEDGRASSMRLASFDVGEEDSRAEMTVIVAGGDLRGNVARWLGQIMGGDVVSSVVDTALAEAKQIKVDNRAAQRFLLKNTGDSSANAIDATIVPLGDDQSVFIKMTGPVTTVESKSDQITDFLESLRLNF